MKNRLLPIAYTSLKLFRHIKQVSRGLNFKASMFRKRKLMYEGMQGLVENRNFCQEKNNVLRSIENIYLSKLVMQKF